ncbi:uncharacterized protein LOC123517993 [Portunus trituberculatus]|uniref:uncharacterized protein LOC123517993 n=1 Tax=Portunus trituberculatus TaxID=210409 RepID=UPI001E1CF8C5|nr:uncharacterized protein LOC123517993 [Portunus trituberculatus]
MYNIAVLALMLIASNLTCGHSKVPLCAELNGNCVSASRCERVASSPASCPAFLICCLSAGSKRGQLMNVRRERGAERKLKLPDKMTKKDKILITNLANRDFEVEQFQRVREKGQKSLLKNWKNFHSKTSSKARKILALSKDSEYRSAAAQRYPKLKSRRRGHNQKTIKNSESGTKRKNKFKKVKKKDGSRGRKNVKFSKRKNVKTKRGRDNSEKRNGIKRVSKDSSKKVKTNSVERIKDGFQNVQENEIQTKGGEVKVKKGRREGKLGELMKNVTQGIRYDRKVEPKGRVWDGTKKTEENKRRKKNDDLKVKKKKDQYKDKNKEVKREEKELRKAYSNKVKTYILRDKNTEKGTNMRGKEILREGKKSEVRNKGKRKKKGDSKDGAYRIKIQRGKSESRLNYTEDENEVKKSNSVRDEGDRKEGKVEKNLSLLEGRVKCRQFKKCSSNEARCVALGTCRTAVIADKCQGAKCECCRSGCFRNTKSNCLRQGGVCKKKCSSKEVKVKKGCMKKKGRKCVCCKLKGTTGCKGKSKKKCDVAGGKCRKKCKVTQTELPRGCKKTCRCCVTLVSTTEPAPLPTSESTLSPLFIGLINLIIEKNRVKCIQIAVTQLETALQNTLAAAQAITTGGETRDISDILAADALLTTVQEALSSKNYIELESLKTKLESSTNSVMKVKNDIQNGELPVSSTLLETIQVTLVKASQTIVITVSELEQIDDSIGGIVNNIILVQSGSTTVAAITATGVPVMTAAGTATTTAPSATAATANAATTAPGTTTTIAPGTAAATTTGAVALTFPGAAATTVPGVAATTVPGGAATTAPGAAATTVPGAAATTPPDAAATTVPGAAATTVPGGAATTAPGAAATTAPGAVATTAPGAAATTAPGAAATTAPGAAATTVPGAAATTAPGAAATTAPGAALVQVQGLFCEFLEKLMQISLPSAGEDERRYKIQRLLQRPSNISCFDAYASTFTLHYTPSSPPWPSQHLTCPSSWRPQASRQAAVLSLTCDLLENDRPTTTPRNGRGKGGRHQTRWSQANRRSTEHAKAQDRQCPGRGRRTHTEVTAKRKIIVIGSEYRIRQDSPQPASNRQWIRVPEAGNRIPPALSDPVDPDPVLGSCPALSVSHGKERKAHQPLPTSAWATPRSALTCIAYKGHFHYRVHEMADFDQGLPQFLDPSNSLELGNLIIHISNCA